MRGLTPFSTSINPIFLHKKAHIIDQYLIYSMNNKFVPSVCSLQKTLQNFYSAAVTGMLQSEQKIQVLRLFLKKIYHFQIQKIAKPQNEEWNIQTQASLLYTQELGLNEECRRKVSPNMFYTFLFSHTQQKGLVESDDIIKIKLNVDFASEQLNRVTLYAILVYCFHCTRGDQSAAMPHEQAKHLLRMIKKAQVKAAYLLRESFGRKLYAKTRFLCEKLHENMERTVSSTEKVIKIIVEEFHPCFIDEVFSLLSQLQSTPNSMALPSLSSMDITRHITHLSLDDRSKRSEETLKNALQNLNVNLIVRSGSKTEEIGGKCRINVVFEEDAQSGYCLKEIGLFRDWKIGSSVRG